MLHLPVIELVYYKEENGRAPFTELITALRDKRAQARILTRLRQVEAGNLGDSKSVGEGIIELRVDVGAGYRVYAARSGKSLVILLCGGDKSTQQKDIKRAKELWADWRSGRNEKS
jgi:putative addiction module killer protein